MRRIQIARNTLHNGKIWQSYLENLFGLQSSENLFSGVVFRIRGEEKEVILRGVFSAGNVPLDVSQTCI